MSVLQVVSCHLNIILSHILLTFITGTYSGILCSRFSRFVETSYLTFIAIQLSGIWVWGISKQITVLHIYGYIHT